MLCKCGKSFSHIYKAYNFHMDQVRQPLIDFLTIAGTSLSKPPIFLAVIFISGTQMIQWCFHNCIATLQHLPQHVKLFLFLQNDHCLYWNNISKHLELSSSLCSSSSRLYSSCELVNIIFPRKSTKSALGCENPTCQYHQEDMPECVRMESCNDIS